MKSTPPIVTDSRFWRSATPKPRKAHIIEVYDAIAVPVVEKVWEGKQLPFPVLIDGEGKTSGSYGIQTWPTVLVD